MLGAYLDLMVNRSFFQGLVVSIVSISSKPWVRGLEALKKCFG